MQICSAIHKGLVKWLQEYDFIYAGARMGGHLAYLPDLKRGRLIPLEEFLEEWKESPGAEKGDGVAPPLGGTKMNAEWLADRFNWLNADGRAPPAKWEKEEEGAEESETEEDVAARASTVSHL